MSKWDKPSEELIALLHTILEPFDHTFRKMFGSTSFFVNGNMFAGVFEEFIFLRLSEEDREAIRKKHVNVSNFDPLGGRPMREYMLLSTEIIENIPELEDWIEKSYNFTFTFPIKMPKRKKR